MKGLKDPVPLCQSCRDDAVEFYVKMAEPPSRIFFAKALSYRKSKDYREVFYDVDSFSEWCQNNIDDDMPYVFGITTTNVKPNDKQIRKWINGGDEPSSCGKIFWTNNPEEDWLDPEDWEKLVEMYHDGDSNFSNIDDPDVVWEMDLTKFFDFVKSKQKKMMENLTHAIAFTKEQEEQSSMSD